MTRRRSSERLPLSLMVLFVALAVLAFSLTGCTPSTTPNPPVAAETEASPSTSASIPVAPGSTADPTPTRTPTGVVVTPQLRMQVRVYLVRGEYLGVGTERFSPATSPARTAMTQLLAGPNASEKAMDLRSEIPKGTKLLGLSISGGTATVDLSKKFESGGGTLSMTLRIAQVVNTLTQFRTVKRVTFKLDGKKVESIGGEGVIVAPSVKRSDFESALPAIMLERPLPGSTIRSPVRITGTANVFEAQFVVRITDADGRILAEKPVMATSGTGTRGTFDKQVSYKKPKTVTGTLTVYEPSAKDGSETNVVSIPVRF